MNVRPDTSTPGSRIADQRTLALIAEDRAAARTPDGPHTAELIALARVAAEYDGLFAAHLRSEGETFLEALDEFLTIVREAGIRGEIYHLKASGRGNWPKLATVIERVEAARAEGLPVTADMYTYHASSTGLDAMMPGWVQEGGHRA